MRTILLIMIGLSVSAWAGSSRFSRDDTKQIVTDNNTGLQWQDNADAKNITKTWIEAINYCENLTLGGYDDWRLPNINEPKSILDRSKISASIVDDFINDSIDDYWSSSTYAGHKDNAWTFFLYGGDNIVYYWDKNESHHIRCVRAGQ